MRKWLKAVIVALLLAMALDTVIPDVCQTLTPDDWFLWWLHGCGKDSGGGGGGGAS